MKNPVLFFMQFDDKYWALFLVSVFVIWYLATENVKKGKSGETVMRMTWYGAAAYLLVFCLPLYGILIKIFPQMDSYYELGYVIPLLPVMAAAGTWVVLRAGNDGYRRILGMLAGAIVLLSIAGDFAYVPSHQQPMVYDCTEDEKEVFDMILLHAEERGEEDEILIWGMPDLMIKSMFYDETFVPVYQKDIVTAPQNYNENLQDMYERYGKYVVPSNKADRLREYLGVIAWLPYLYGELQEGYVVVYDPKWQLTQAGNEVDLKKEEVLEIFKERDYETVGSTQRRIVFYKAGE